MVRAIGRERGVHASFGLACRVRVPRRLSSPVHRPTDPGAPGRGGHGGGAGVGQSQFTGVVRARVESDLGFRVAGKIAQRLVDAGQSVRRGQPLDAA